MARTVINKKKIPSNTFSANLGKRLKSMAIFLAKQVDFGKEDTTDFWHPCAIAHPLKTAKKKAGLDCLIFGLNRPRTCGPLGLMDCLADGIAPFPEHSRLVRDLWKGFHQSEQHFSPALGGHSRSGLVVASTCWYAGRLANSRSSIGAGEGGRWGSSGPSAVEEKMTEKEADKMFQELCGAPKIFGFTQSLELKPLN